MQKLIKVLATSLVDYPEEVEVKEIEGENALIVELKVADADMGKVIGKQGKIARAIRALAKAKGNKIGRNVVVEIVS
ncbi:MAG: KH domain-containing protein [Syntrophaceticus schinkii]